MANLTPTNKKVTELPVATTVAPTDVLLVVQGGVTKQVTHDTVLTAIAGSTKLAATYVPLAQVSMDVAAMADGAVSVFDTGQPVIETHNSATGSALAVASGQLTNTASNAGAAAGYYEAQLNGNVKVIAGKFVWGSTGSTSGGRVVLACFQPSIRSTYPTIPPAACHFLISQAGWTYGVWNNGDPSATVIASGTFATPLVAGTEYGVEVVFDGGKAILWLPDGTKAVLTDSRISTLMGVYACWEVFLTTASTDFRPGFTELYAESVALPRRRNAYARFRDIVTIAREIVRQKLTVQSGKSILYGPSTPGVTFAITTSSAAIDATNLNISSMVVPDSGYITVEEEASLTMTAATSVYFFAVVGGAGGSGSSTVAVVDNAQVTGRVHATHRMGPFTPGATISVLWKVSAGANSAANVFIRGDNGHPAVMTVAPTT